MQGISVYKIGESGSVAKPVYHTFHERNGDYLERENEKQKYPLLGEVDDCDPSTFSGAEIIVSLMAELDLVVEEADGVGDLELANHLKEILVLCKLCVWNSGEMWIHMSPYEFVPPEKYPAEIPQKFRHNISRAGLLTNTS